MKRRCGFGLAVVAVLYICGEGCRATPPPPPPEVASEWPLLVQLGKPLVRRLAANNRPNAQGALGRNRRAFFSVAFQRPVTWSFAAGCLTEDYTLVADGVRALEYTFERQNSDGSFQFVVPSEFGDKKPNDGDLASAAVFFYSELGRSLLLLKGSKWFQQSEETDELRARMRRINDKANTSLTWLLKQEKILHSYDQEATNRYFFDAMGFYLTGKALGRTEAMEVGLRFLCTALERQTGDGTFLEKGGFDSSYQAVSLFRALLLYVNLDAKEQELRVRLWKAIVAGIDKEMHSVTPKGQISTEGNTRVRPGGERFLGREKSMAYVDAVLAFYYYGFLTGEQKYIKTAQQVLKFYAG